MAKIEATWILGLYCDCPNCEELVDLLDGPDFWDGRSFDVVEHGTENTKDVEVVCPSCKHEFVVDLTW